jgi:type I restriction enzyme S subunit
MKSTSNEILPQGYKMTELGPLSEEWEVVRLGDVYDVQQGKQLSEKESKEGKIKKPFLRTSNLNWGNIDISSTDEMYFTTEEFERLRLKSDDILVCEGGDIGRTALYRGELAECAYQNHLYRMRPKKDNVNVEFFVFWMNHAINQRGMYTYSANRTTIPNLSGSRLKEFIFPLPPLPEQQKIAAVLSAVQDAKEKDQAVIDATKALKKSMMKHLFTYGPVSPEETENVPLKDTEIGKVPEEWEVVRLGEVTEKTKQKDPRRDSNTEFKYVDVSAISNDTLKIISYSEFLGKDAPHRARKAIQNDDIIFATVRPYLKRIAIVPENLNGQIASTAFCVIRCKKQIVNPYYIFYTVGLDNFVNRVTENQRGSSYPAVTDKDILNQYIPLPPLPVQQKIASILSAIDDKIEAEENKKKAIEELFKTILHNLMTAKIRVNHLEINV